MSGFTKLHVIMASHGYCWPWVRSRLAVVSNRVATAGGGSKHVTLGVNEVFRFGDLKERQCACHVWFPWRHGARGGGSRRATTLHVTSHVRGGS